MRSSVSSTPNPLPHGATGTVEWSTSSTYPLWCEVGLLTEDGDYTSVKFLSLSRGQVEFTFGVTPTWDGTGGGTIQLRLFDFRNGRQRNLATGVGTYL